MDDPIRQPRSAVVSCIRLRAFSSQAPTVALWVALGIATFIAYWPAMRGTFLWDDNAHVTRQELRSPDGLRRIWFELGATQQYYPLLHSAFWIESQLWGDHPLGYHLVNVALHLAAAGLVYLILRQLKIPGALLAAALFALHPVQVETVAWISEQKNTLSAVFYLAATLVYLRFDQERKRSLYFAALALFVAALLSKSITATLPAALLVIFWWQRGRLGWRRDVRPLAPFFVLGIAAGLFTAWVERTLIGANGATFELPLLARGLLAGRAIWFYIGKLLWPANLLFVYPRWDIDARVWWQWLYPAAALAVPAVLWRVAVSKPASARGTVPFCSAALPKLGQSPPVLKHSRGPLAGYLFFVGTLFPALGFLNVYPFMFSYVADHFQYLASLGIIVPVAAGIAKLAEKVRRSSWMPLRHRWIGHAIFGAGSAKFLSVFAVLAFQQSHMYCDAETLYRATLERNPACWMAHNNLGILLKDSDRLPEAIEHYQQALAIKPDNAETHNNFGDALIARGHLEDAIEQFETALRIVPRYAEAQNNWGVALLKQGNSWEAMDHFKQAVDFRPDYAGAHNNLGNVLCQLGDLPHAIEHLERTVLLKPGFAEAECNLAVALMRAGRTEEAVVHCQQCVRLQPNSTTAYASLAMAMARMHRGAEAIAAGESALKLARQHGQNELAGKIEGWLAAYVESQANSHPEALSLK